MSVFMAKNRDGTWRVVEPAMGGKRMAMSPRKMSPHVMLITKDMPL